MLVSKEESQTGTLLSYTFRAETGEDSATFKAATKAWIIANLPAFTWEEFYNRVTHLSNNSIALDMT